MNKLELVFVLIISVFLLFIPLMIYLFVRSGERCRRCGKKSLIPLISPTAQAALKGMVQNTAGVSVAPARVETAGLATPPPAPESLRGWISRNPLWLAALLIFWLTVIGVVARQAELKQGPESDAIVKQRQHMQELAQANHQKEQEIRNRASQKKVPTFQVFKSKPDSPVAYVVSESTSDDDLEALLWFFRQRVRTGKFKEIGINQPTAKQWGSYGYKSGMLLVFRGQRCASEPYAKENGSLGPCGYGEHDDGMYQWGISADPAKDSGEIRAKNGNASVIFDYRDNWSPGDGL